MSGENRLVLLDTNVLVYAFSESNESRCQRARRLFEELVEQDRLCLSTQVLQELLVTLTNKLGVDWADALTVVADLAQFPLFQVDKTAVLDAGRLARDSRISFWDALIVTAASRLGAGRVLTEDLSHGQKFGSVTVENPFAAAR